MSSSLKPLGAIPDDPPPVDDVPHWGDVPVVGFDTGHWPPDHSSSISPLPLS